LCGGEPSVIPEKSGNLALGHSELYAFYFKFRESSASADVSVLTKVLLTFAVLFPVVSLLAHGRDSYFIINGDHVSYDEFRRRGGFLALFLIGVCCAVLAYGLLHASRWSRPLLLLPAVASLVLVVIRHHTAPLPLYNYLSSLPAIILLAWYLFYRQTVKNYYINTN
jgi:hypothetical protein